MGMATSEGAEGQGATALSAAAQKRALTFIFITMFLDVVALGIMIPVLPQLVKGFEGGDTARASVIYGLFQTSWMVVQFFASPILGALSDRFGRRPIILLSCAGLGLDYIFMALAPSLTVLFIGRLISGATAATYGTAGAYIADVTPPEKRAAGFGIIGAAFGLGFITGPALGGLLGRIDLHLPFWVSAGLMLVAALYGAFVLPESLPKERRSKFSLRKANPVGSLLLYVRHPGLLGLAGVLTLYWLAHFSLQSVYVLYTSHRYAWDELRVGLSLALIGVGSALVQTQIVPRAVPRLGDRRCLLTGLTFGTLGFLCFALAPTAPWFWASMPVFVMWGLASPTLQGLMSRIVEPTAQGRLQGANGAVMSITGIVGPVMYSQVFAWSIRPDGPAWLAGLKAPGAPYILAAFLLALALMQAWRATRATEQGA